MRKKKYLNIIVFEDGVIKNLVLHGGNILTKNLF